jgi:hypothetical protein
MQAVERTALAVNLDMGGESTDTGGESTDIASYERLAIESANTVVELRQLIESIEALARSEWVNQQIPPAFWTLRDEIDYFLHRFFILLALTMVLYFGVLFLYRHGIHRYHSPRD